MMVGDTGDSTAVDAATATIVERFGGIDIWVNNAARLLVRPLVETRTGTACSPRTSTGTSMAAAAPQG